MVFINQWIIKFVLCISPNVCSTASSIDLHVARQVMRPEHWPTSETSQCNVGQVACSRTRSATAIHPTQLNNRTRQKLNFNILLTRTEQNFTIYSRDETR